MLKLFATYRRHQPSTTSPYNHSKPHKGWRLQPRTETKRFELNTLSGDLSKSRPKVFSVRKHNNQILLDSSLMDEGEFKIQLPKRNLSPDSFQKAPKIAQRLCMRSETVRWNLCLIWALHITLLIFYFGLLSRSLQQLSALRVLMTSNFLWHYYMVCSFI